MALEGTAVIHRWLRVNNMGVHAAMRLAGLGVLVAGCGVAAPGIAVLRSHLSAHRLDFVRGLFFGLALAFFIMGVTAIVAAAKLRGKNGRRKP